MTYSTIQANSRNNLAEDMQAATTLLSADTTTGDEVCN